MADRKSDGGHDGKGAAPREKTAAGKAVGYTVADRADATPQEDDPGEPDAAPRPAGQPPR